MNSEKSHHLLECMNSNTTLVATMWFEVSGFGTEGQERILEMLRCKREVLLKHRGQDLWA